MKTAQGRKLIYQSDCLNMYYKKTAISTKKRNVVVVIKYKVINMYFYTDLSL